MHFVWIGDHNVNYIGRGDIYGKGDPYTIWNSCDTTGFNTIPEQNPPDYSKKLNEIGWHYFFCGVGSGYHCKSGVKAAINVVKNLTDCPQHVY